MSTHVNSDNGQLVFSGLTLPCGRTVQNRLAKVAMTEQLCRFGGGPPSDEILSLYSKWAAGGWGMVMTGNVHVSTTHRGLLRDLIINAVAPSAMERERYTALAGAMHQAPTGHEAPLAIVQLNHAGRQSPLFIGGRWPWQQPLAPSARRLGADAKGFLSQAFYLSMWQTPKAMTLEDIAAVKQEFVKAAVFCHECGFDGVQVHAAHGYLLAQFLSPLSNRRTDKYRDGAILVREICESIRAAVPSSFVLGVKMNAGDYVTGGLTEEVALEQLAKLATCGVDFIEVSGGSYEAPEFTKSTSTREAFFAQFARAALSQVASIPESRRPKILLTGGLKQSKAINDCLSVPHADMVGIGRQACIYPDFPRQLLVGAELREGPVYKNPAWVPSLMTANASTSWYYAVLRSVARGEPIGCWDSSPTDITFDHFFATVGVRWTSIITTCTVVAVAALVGTQLYTR